LATIGVLGANIALTAPFSYEDTNAFTLTEATTPGNNNSCATAGITTETINFNITDDFTVNDLNVGFMLTSANKRDIHMSITSPAATTVELIADEGAGTDNFNVLIDSEAPDPPGNLMPGSNHAIPGVVFNYDIFGNYDILTTATTVGVLDDFIGENSVGIWTLTMCDDRQGNASNYIRSLLQFDGTVSSILSVVKSTPTITTDIIPLGQVSEGDILQFSIVATNTGAVAQTNVMVSDPLLTPNSASCASVASAATCSLIGSYTVTATDRLAGTFSNTGSAVSDQNASTNSNTVNTAVVNPPQLTVVKSNSSFVDNDVNGYISVGDVLNYTITATNASVSNADILVEDPVIIPSSTSCLNVLPGATCVLAGTYQVLAVDKLAGNILNTATATISGGTGVESNTVQVVVGENPVADAESVFYMPLPEEDALDAFESIFPGPNVNTGTETCPNATGPGNPISTYSSITILRSNTLIYYDHYEDGYETAPNASAQATTGVWGDGDLSNGWAPGNNCLVDSCDVLEAGTIIVLNNQIDTTAPIDLNNLLFNGGDKISATDTISMTKANWSTGPDTLLAGAFELYPTTEWGISYEIPVGQDVSPGFNNAKYQYVGITVMAQADGTSVTVDINGSAAGGESVFTLDEGESQYIDGGILVGATVTATANVQVDIITGDICASYESRFFTLFPTELWDNSYYNPVGTSIPVRTLLYNPDPVNPITVLVLDLNGNTTVPVTAGGFVDYLQANNTAARYCIANNPNDGECNPDGGNFYAIAAIDADPDSAGGQTASREDWGLTLVPTSSLSQQALVGLGFGQDPLLPVTENSSPVWVTADLIEGTPTNGIELCVDYDNDGTDSGPVLTDPVTGQEYDLRITVNPYESLILRDPDGDQTSLLVWVCEYDVNTGNPVTDAGNRNDARNAVIAAAWGQEPGFSGASPAVDVGTGIPNVSSIILLKEGELINDLNGDGFPSIGDTILYKISLTNIGFVPVSPGAVLTDTLPPNVDYVLNSTSYFNSFTSTIIADDLPAVLPDVTTPFPLDADDLNTGISLQDLLAVGNSFLVTFEVTIATLPLVDEEICNNAGVNVPFESVTSEFCIDIVPRNASIGDFVWNDTNNDGIQNVGELGIEGVTVTLVDIAGNPVVDGLNQPITTTTDVSGAWSLTNLAIGDFRVLFDTSTSTDGFNYALTSPNIGGDDAVDSDGLSNGT